MRRPGRDEELAEHRPGPRRGWHEQGQGCVRALVHQERLREPGMAQGLDLDRVAADVDVRLIYDDGDEVSLAAYRRNENRKIKLKKVPLPRTGRVLLIVANGSANAMRVSGKVKGTASEGLSTTLPWGLEIEAGRRPAASRALAGQTR